MGEYKIPEATATLVIDDGPYTGAEIEVRMTLSPAVYFGIRQWLAQATGEEIEPTIEATKEMATIFAEHGLISWNLADGRGPVPATVTGLLSLDFRFLANIIASWLSSIGTVPVPLPVASLAGPAPTARRKRTPRPSTGTSSSEASSPKWSITATSHDSSVSSR